MTHITIKGGCTHNCEIFAEFFLNGGVNSREFVCGMWLITSVKKLSRTLSGAKGPAKLLVANVEPNEAIVLSK